MHNERNLFQTSLDKLVTKVFTFVQNQINQMYSIALQKEKDRMFLYKSALKKIISCYQIRQSSESRVILQHGSFLFCVYSGFTTNKVSCLKSALKRLSFGNSLFRSLTQIKQPKFEFPILAAPRIFTPYSDFFFFFCFQF